MVYCMNYERKFGGGFGRGERGGERGKLKGDREVR